jgi:hypothetical protein
MKRRDFLKGMLAASCAPAIVKAENIMRIAVPPEPAIVIGEDVYANVITIGNMQPDSDARVYCQNTGLQIGDSVTFGGAENRSNNGVFRVTAIEDSSFTVEPKAAEMIRDGGWREIGGDDVGAGLRTNKWLTHDEYGVVIDANGKTVEQLYDEIKYHTRRGEDGDFFMQGAGSVTRKASIDWENKVIDLGNVSPKEDEWTKEELYKNWKAFTKEEKSQQFGIFYGGKSFKLDKKLKIS